MTDAPQSIRRFEILQVASLVVALLHGFAVNDGGVFELTIGLAVTLALTLLVSRRRKNWARWSLLALTIVGAALMSWQARAILAVGYPIITVAVTLVQVIAVALLFTREAGDWLRAEPSPA